LKVTVVGAGGIGGPLGAHLIQAGHEVTFVESNRAHLEAMRERGLHVTGHADLRVRPAAVIAPEELADLTAPVLLAVKSKDTEMALRSIAPRLGPDAYVVSLQNGLEEYKIAAAVGAERTVGAFLTFGGNFAGPGEVVYGGPGSFYLGEIDGRRSRRVEELADVLGVFHPVGVTGNIFGYLWAKGALGCFYFATALVDEDVPDLIARREYRPLFGALVAEAVTVARAEGIRCEQVDGFNPNSFQDGEATRVEQSWQAQERYWAAHVQKRTGVWRDLAIHQRQTEVDHIITPILIRGRDRGLNLPLLERLVEQVREAETGRRALGLANLDDLRDRLGKAG
jgi:2-dehydropantoate 2-reductase